MRYTADHKARSRARIVDQAAALLRERGVDGVGVADVMRQAGLTHGGFYAHFASKDALVVDALSAALDETFARLADAAAQAAPQARLGAIVRSYLSRQHLASPGDGCTFAALGGESARLPPAARAALTVRYQRLVDLVGGALKDAGRPEAEASGIVAAMVGAISLARMVDTPAAASDILQATRRLILHRGA